VYSQWPTQPDTIVTQDNVAVQIEAFGDRCPFEADQGREAAWIVKPIRNPGGFIPNAVID